MAEETQEVVSQTALAAIVGGEIDAQVRTAKAHPRSITRFLREAHELVTLDEDVAGSCIYALERREKNGKVKTIDGPSIRFAEMILSTWGNSRAGARIVGEDDRFVTAQGVCHDLERNVSVSFEVRRRITNRDGKRYSDDMVATTANAACSIALRDAIERTIPKAIWSRLYEAARAAAVGKAETMTATRAKMLEAFSKMGVPQEMIFGSLGIIGVEDIGADEVLLLRGKFTAIRDGQITIEQAFPPADQGLAPPVAKAKAQPEAPIMPPPAPVAEPTTVEGAPEGVENVVATIFGVEESKEGSLTHYEIDTSAGIFQFMRRDVKKTPPEIQICRAAIQTTEALSIAFITRGTLKEMVGVRPS